MAAVMLLSCTGVALAAPASVLGNPDSWCKAHAGLLAGKKINTALIAEEFNIKELDSLQDAFIDLVDKPSSMRAYGSPKLWRSSFETVKVRGLYDAFVAFPEPAMLAVIIDMSRNAADAQEKNDARMALAFIHLMGTHLSVKPDRWNELHKQAGNDHWTALVFKARLYAYGEHGLKPDAKSALGFLLQAGSKKNEYLQSRGRYEWDKSNYEIPYNNLVVEITSSAPGKYPAFEQFNGLIAKVEAAQKQYMARWPHSRPGKLSQLANQANQESLDLGVKILSLSQSDNAGSGAVANVMSLRDSKAGERPTFAYIDPKVESMTLAMMKQSGDLNGDQKKLLEQAQQKRYLAQGVIAQASADLAAQFFGGMAGASGGIDDIFVRTFMLVPAIMQTQTALIQSCAISTKWEQAMRAKSVPVTAKAKIGIDVNTMKDE